MCAVLSNTAIVKYTAKILHEILVRRRSFILIKWVQWGWVNNISKFYVNAVILFAYQTLLPTNSIRGLNVLTSSFRLLESYLNKEPSPPMIGVRSNTIKGGTCLRPSANLILCICKFCIYSNLVMRTECKICRRDYLFNSAE